ncbi:MAG TPA: glycerophosphodiester phosphodiesterase family protein [Armatimonadota bacterium]
MQSIAHRGYSAIAPENTLAAFRSALAEHADGVEFDVHLSADGIPVVIHDPVLGRTTNGTGEVRAHTVAQLQALDAGSWKSPEFAGERIPLLKDTLALLRGRTIPYIELKAPGTAGPMVALLQELAMSEQVVVMSFDEGLLQEVIALDPQIHVRLLVGTDNSEHPEDAWRTAAQRVGTMHLSIIEQALTPARVKLLHVEGYDIFAWTVDKTERMQELIDMGVDSIASNRIDALMHVAGG